MSGLPTRRVTRATARPTVLKDKENATARNGRTAASRAKPPSTQAASEKPENIKPAGLSRVTASTAATRAKSAGVAGSKVDPSTQIKRKREALGEVPKPPENRAGPADAGAGAFDFKGKEKVKEVKEKFEGVVVKQTTTTTTVARKPIRTVVDSSTTTTAIATSTTRRTRTTIAPSQSQLKPLREHDEDAMAVDSHPVAPIPSPKRFVAAREEKRTGIPAQSRVPRRVTRPQSREVDEEEAHRAFKKRRTSSDVPEVEALHEEEVENAVAPGEADPNGDEWDDLDAEDDDDPLMVSEYVVEIFEYLKVVEQESMPNPKYMANQKDLAWKMRGVLTDWLVQVHSRFRLLPETLFLCVNIIDRFLSARVVSLAKLQLVGITCMFIAAKVEEILAPSASNFLYCADSSYTETEILQAERYVLKTIEWNLSYPSPIHFLRRISKADDYNIQVRTIGKYLLEIQCLEWRLIAAPPSLLAAAAIWFARLIIGFTEWTPNLAHYASYRESDLIPTANLMLNYVLKPVEHESFFKKYASKKYMKASVFVHDWAREHWAENARVDLASELPALKEVLRERREQEERLLAAQDANGYDKHHP
ncbi:cyclin-like protein [Epithele typhae]|uniref:cyclin-like protein n=1 Tax=Epithele typhae TaxID=378194 RepID=UPI00200874C0|nr:cyclin-like protein [Epithele typhae]KAH9941167.1 cyclin-like protein [Epithele typhae]